MRTILKKVYYCDFCKKYSLRSLATHEKHCTGNVNRKCRLCEDININDIPTIVKGYNDRITNSSYNPDNLIFGTKIEWKGEPITLEGLVSDVGDCPNCALTVMRCADLYRLHSFEYDYQKHLTQWWADVNEEQRAEQEHQAYS